MYNLMKSLVQPKDAGLIFVSFCDDFKSSSLSCGTVRGHECERQVLIAMHFRKSSSYIHLFLFPVLSLLCVLYLPLSSPASAVIALLILWLSSFCSPRANTVLGATSAWTQAPRSKASSHHSAGFLLYSGCVDYITSHARPGSERPSLTPTPQLTPTRWAAVSLVAKYPTSAFVSNDVPVLCSP